MLFVLFAFPLLLLVIFGYAISFDVKHAKMGILDKENTEESRAFTRTLTSNENFDLVTVLHSDKNIKNLLDERVVQAIIVIPEDFSRNFLAGREVKLQVLVDGVNGNTASILQNYINNAVNSYSQSLAGNAAAISARKTYIPVRLEPLFWYNPTLNSTFMLIPGLISMILILTAVVSISLSIVREKEKGTMEQILVSPVSSFELMIGKVIPYIFIALFICTLILMLSRILFGMEIKGSYFHLLWTTLLFIFSALSLGIFVSSIAKSQQVAFQIAILISMLPSVILSGFVFPIESMPVVIQWFTNITPSKFYLIILKNIMSKGTGASVFWPDAIYLSIFAFIFLTLAVLINKKQKLA
jgi:ABC-2 type transport system permease protein